MERISWPSNNVVQGGAFHQRHVNYSPATHDMIKSKTLLYWHDINPIIFFSLTFSLNDRGKADYDAT